MVAQGDKGTFSGAELFIQKSQWTNDPQQAVREGDSGRGPTCAVALDSRLIPPRVLSCHCVPSVGQKQGRDRRDKRAVTWLRQQALPPAYGGSPSMPIPRASGCTEHRVSPPTLAAPAHWRPPPPAATYRRPSRYAQAHSMPGCQTATLLTRFIGKIMGFIKPWREKDAQHARINTRSYRTCLLLPSLSRGREELQTRANTWVDPFTPYL